MFLILLSGVQCQSTGKKQMTIPVTKGQEGRLAKDFDTVQTEGNERLSGEEALIPSPEQDKGQAGDGQRPEGAAGAQEENLQFFDSPFGIMAAYNGRKAPQYLKDLNVHWVRQAKVLFFKRTYIDKNGWQKPDYMVQRAFSDGVNQIIPGISLIAREENVRGGKPQKKDRAAVYDKKAHSLFLEGYINRYKGRVKYFQVGNEFNVFWKGRPEDLVDMLRFHYETIKRLCPECKIIFGALSSTPQDYYPDRVSKGRFCIRDFLEFLAKSRQSPDEQFFDVFDFHWYGTLGEYKSIKIGRETLQETDLATFIRDIKDDFNRLNIKAELFICEAGTHSDEINDSRIPYKRQTEREQASELIKRYVYPISLGVKKIFWTTLLEWYRFGQRENSFFDNTGLVNNPRNKVDKRDWKKLSFYTYQLMVEKLEGSDWDNVETIQGGKDNVYIFRFKKRSSGRIIYVMWWDFFREQGYKSGDTKEIKLKSDTKAVRLTEAIPDAEDGSKIKDSHTFRTEFLETNAGIVTIPLSINPVYVEALDDNT